MAAAVMSVEKKFDGHAGVIRIVRANELYKKVMGPDYYDDMVYSELIPPEPNFEDFCYRCAVKKQHLHAYVDTKSMGVWTDGTYIPLSSACDSDTLCYLLFVFELTKNPESKRMSDISLDSATFVVQTCINLRGSVDFLESMNKVISGIQERTESFSSCIFMIDTEQKRAVPLCSKYRNDEATIEDFLPYLPYEVIASWIDTVKDRDTVIVKDEFDMAELEKINPLWVKSLKSANVKSLVLVPLRQGKKIMGFLFITNFNTKRLVEIKDFIELTGFFLSSEIANNTLVEKLEYLSSIDSLTGVNNRNAMNMRVDYHVGGRMTVKPPYGVVFADLNGLKQCNDQGGHEAGDKLLQKASELLRKEFEGYEIYRAGSDEFVVIMPQTDKNTFDKTVAHAKEASSYGNPICFAIGASWSDGSIDLRRCMHIADSAMYVDKKAYYEAHPKK